MTERVHQETMSYAPGVVGVSDAGAARAAKLARRWPSSPVQGRDYAIPF